MLKGLAPNPAQVTKDTIFLVEASGTELWSLLASASQGLAL